MKEKTKTKDFPINNQNNSCIKKKEIKHKIYFSINGEGYGHSSRALAIAMQLKPDEVLLGGYGYVLKRLEKTGLPTVEIMPEITFIGKDGSFDIGLTLLKNSSWPVLINQIIKEEKKIIEDFGITCVISDSRTAPVFAAQKLGLPCILLTNQTTFAPFFDVHFNDLERGLPEDVFNDLRKVGTQAILSAAEPLAQKVINDWFEATDEIFLPDLPPPYSLSLPLLSNENVVKKKQRFLGPLLPWNWKSVKHNDKYLSEEYRGFKKKIVCILGGHKYRKPLFDSIVSLAMQMPDILFIVLSSFKADVILKNLLIHDFVENPAEYYLNANLVITQAGHSTAMELITLGVPMLVVPDTGQIEQESNAKRLWELGVATTLSYKDLNTKILFKQVNEMLSDERFLNESKKLSEIAKSFIADEEAVRVIRDYSTRIQTY
jgi:UDP:flavonoid glycosyltransferase YjiC (YdhE family)